MVYGFAKTNSHATLIGILPTFTLQVFIASFVTTLKSDYGSPADAQVEKLRITGRKEVLKRKKEGLFKRRHHRIF